MMEWNVGPLPTGFTALSSSYCSSSPSHKPAMARRPLQDAQDRVHGECEDAKKKEVGARGLQAVVARPSRHLGDDAEGGPDLSNPPFLVCLPCHISSIARVSRLAIGRCDSAKEARRGENGAPNEPFGLREAGAAPRPAGRGCLVASVTGRLYVCVHGVRLDRTVYAVCGGRPEWLSRSDKPVIPSLPSQALLPLGSAASIPRGRAS